MMSQTYLQLIIHDGLSDASTPALLATHSYMSVGFVTPSKGLLPQDDCIYCVG